MQIIFNLFMHAIYIVLKLRVFHLNLYMLLHVKFVLSLKLLVGSLISVM